MGREIMLRGEISVLNGIRTRSRRIYEKMPFSTIEEVKQTIFRVSTARIRDRWDALYRSKNREEWSARRG